MKYLGHSFRGNESLTLCISEIIKLTSISHCFPKLDKCCHPSALQMQKSNRKEIRLFYKHRTDEIPYHVSFTPNTWYLHAWKISVTIVTINLAFVLCCEDYKNMFQRNCLFAALTREIFSTLEEKFRVSARPCNILCIQLFWERLSEKVHATILKGIVGDFKCTVFQRNLKESYGRPLIYVWECWRKVIKVGSTATVVRNSVLIISHITFRDCRVHFIL